MNLCSLSHEIRFEIIFLFFQTNAIRGIIAAVCFAAIFVILGILEKFLWRPTPKDKLRNSLPKSDYEIKLDKNGLDNPVMLD